MFSALRVLCPWFDVNHVEHQETEQVKVLKVMLHCGNQHFFVSRKVSGTVGSILVHGM